MAIFNSYIKLPEGKWWQAAWAVVEESWENYILVKKAQAGLGWTQTEKASDWLLQIWFTSSARTRRGGSCLKDIYI